MWEYPCVALACVGLIFFGVRTVFSVLACQFFPLCMLDIIPLVGGVTGVVIRACPGLALWVLLFAL